MPFEEAEEYVRGRTRLEGVGEGEVMRLELLMADLLAGRLRPPGSGGSVLFLFRSPWLTLLAEGLKLE